MTIFEDKRADYSPYGLKCDVWHPSIMPRFDHHNEIEINYIPGGSLRYFFHDRIVTVPGDTVCVFWAFFSHRIVDFVDVPSYYVVTIPMARFLTWNLSREFVNSIFSGDMVIQDAAGATWDAGEFERWVDDSRDLRLSECMGLELQSKLRRMDIIGSHGMESVRQTGEMRLDKTHAMILYISHNFTSAIRTADIADAVGLNPDYAGALFRKTTGMTLGEYVQKERIAFAQRELLFTDKNITRISYDAGFNSISSFNISFKAITGLTPREYRKLARSGDTKIPGPCGPGYMSDRCECP